MNDWYGLYAGTWNGDIVPAAYAHPAKFSRLLIARIYDYAIERGYLRPGDSVVDCFGGVGLGALDAIKHGIDWTGVELESNFVELGNQNIALWNERYGRYNALMGKPYGTARLLQGDSRKLAEVVGARAEMCVSSPPYAERTVHGRTGIDLSKLERPGKQCQATVMEDYGTTAGQLGAMPEGSFTAAISSPPYSNAIDGSGEGPGARHDPIYHNGDNAYKKSNGNEYGRTPGNLGNMAGDGYSAAISSPPYEGSSGNPVASGTDIMNGFGKGDISKRGAGRDTAFYGAADGQIGQTAGETFWTAARAIVEQVYTVLRPGGVGIFVCKDFIRSGQRVPFSDQWESLCVACGFEQVERIHAWVIEDKGTQYDIFGNTHTKLIERKSFFRRLAERKGSPRIDWEDVLILKKPHDML